MQAMNIGRNIAVIGLIVLVVMTGQDAVQDADRECLTDCLGGCPLPGDATKATIAACQSKCTRCYVHTGAVLPKYYILALVYAPPGCSGSAGQGCQNSGSVTYTTGSSATT